MRSKNFLITLGSGGHSAEMCRWIGHEIDEATFVLHSEDLHSSPPFKAKRIIRIPRARSVGQRCFTTIFTATCAFICTFWRLWMELKEEEFDVILTNGPSISIAVVLYFWIRRMLNGTKECRIVFVESVTRVTRLSLSGRIVHPFVDVVVVWWPELQHVGCSKCCLVRLVKER